MKIKSIVFTDENNPSYGKLEAVITASLTSLTGQDGQPPSAYSNVFSGLTEIAGALKTSNVIMIFADDKMYHEAKRNICRAFKFEMLHNELVLEKLRAMRNNERYMVHALLPKNATPFPLSDGLFPGFAIRSKSQCIFFLPFSEDRTFITMKKYVFPYIQRVYGARLPSFNEYETAYAAAVLEEQLYASGEHVAIANTSICKYIAHAAKRIEYFNDYISYAPYSDKDAEKGRDTSLRKLSAVKAARYYEYRFGASVIEDELDIYGHYNVTIIISNGKTATIRTLSSIADESHEDFMCTVVTEFFLMLAHELENAPELTKEDKKYLKPTSTIHGIRLFIYLVLFATSFFLTYVAISFSNSSFFA